MRGNPNQYWALVIGQQYFKNRFETPMLFKTREEARTAAKGFTPRIKVVRVQILLAE